MDYFERVKALTRAKNTTIEAVANSAGLTRDSYNSYKKKGNLPRADEAMKMADTLETTVEYLVDGRETPLSLASSIRTRPELEALINRLVPLGKEDIIRATGIIDLAFPERSTNARADMLDEERTGT
jgi:transcriptional regulator with XRE-family HTH domain